jgi:hypothetical protein
LFSLIIDFILIGNQINFLIEIENFEHFDVTLIMFEMWCHTNNWKFINLD